MAIFTTLNDIREHSPCASGWTKLLKSLGKTHSDNEPLPLEHILESNGLDDAIWALRAIKNHDKGTRLFAYKCAHLVLPIFEEKYSDDDRPRKAIEAAGAYARGEISESEISAAARAAYAAYAICAADVAAAYAAEAACAANAAARAADVSAAYAAEAARVANAACAAAKLKIEKLFRELCNS